MRWGGSEHRYAGSARRQIGRPPGTKEGGKRGHHKLFILRDLPPEDGRNYREGGISRHAEDWSGDNKRGDSGEKESISEFG